VVLALTTTPDGEMRCALAASQMGSKSSIGYVRIGPQDARGLVLRQPVEEFVHVAHDVHHLRRSVVARVDEEHPDRTRNAGGVRQHQHSERPGWNGLGGAVGAANGEVAGGAVGQM